MSTEISEKQYVKVPLFPTYEQARYLYKSIDGIERRLFNSLLSSIFELTGTPQKTEDWTEPEQWIPERLKGAERDLAFHIWQSSNKTLNPRHMRGHWYMARTYKLLEEIGGKLCLTEDGKDFIDNLYGEITRKIDEREGLIKILSLVAELGSGRRGNFLAAWKDFLQANSGFQSESIAKDSLRRRLVNLTERELIQRSGMTYEVTSNGLEYLAQMQNRVGPTVVITPSRLSELQRLAREQRLAVREALSEYLHQMHPYDFEFLIKQLLEELGYQNVIVTTQSNDKGVDLVAEIEVGITPVKEVIQAKRYTSNTQRRVLDELRGSLHRFEANRGTIITTSNYSKGAKDAAFERGAAPIQLIDGERLIDLLIENNIGVRRSSIEILELDIASFDNGEQLQDN